jgi:hypothetical protein
MVSTEARRGGAGRVADGGAFSGGTGEASSVRLAGAFFAGAACFAGSGLPVRLASGLVGSDLVGSD